MNEDIDRLLYRIITGKLIFNYNNKEYCLVQRTSILKYRATLLYSSIINDEKYNEWIRNENLEKYMMFLSVWTRDMASFVTRADKQMDDLKVSIYNNRFNLKQTNKLKKQLQSTREQLNNVLVVKQTYHAHTLEGYAESLKYEFIIMNTLFHKKKKVFSSHTAHSIFNSLVSEINQYNISSSNYRQLARSEMWRSYWSLGKEQVFNKAISSWTDEQRSLAGFSNMYDSIYAHPEKPPDSVIEDDDMLDGWMILQNRTNDKNKQQDELLKSNPKLGKAQEVFVFTDNANTASEILDMNSNETLATIKERFHKIDKFEKLDQHQLPDVFENLNKQ